MSDKKFIRILIVIAVAGTLLTAAHMAYIAYAYNNSSIIQFVAREYWP
ncbi:MAG: hypothetical protein J5715_03565 [Clostridiales bacterium]|nr:hypothetical protein [Clostridiales bacterium]MBO4579213.1 hypothetical protein [Clostridiales bacterium]